ncbi:Uma2 family endonuclease [Siminovitchia fortis]|uniref:Uma2 family endonuclease n=1 Tax=Siminovitchia fortis TaxID=254758 RepID=A0A443IJ28_9BACI|nr:Uma2 family endonuclease [Siminovitchia fortis]
MRWWTVIELKVPGDRLISFMEYEEMRKDSDERLEYVDGVVYMSPSPSTRHQRISVKLSAKLFNLLDGTGCEVLTAPYDIELAGGEKDEQPTVIIPDLSVICDQSGFTDQRYIGTPDLIIEIVSPSNQSYDLIFKTNLYQKNKVKEYWIVNPILDNIMVYTLDENDQYCLVENEKEGIVKSRIIEGFEVDVQAIFN